MGKIKQLPEDVAIKIAAGEVVERPASVVKELVENALDAGATKVEVTIRDGGKTLVEVRDNGSGMDREDAVNAFLRHGTSKIRSADDLAHVMTLGFRGEALAAIGASAHVELVTSQKDEIEGTQVVLQDGGAPEVKPHAPVGGTIIRVREVFASLPVRQKFLKSDATEWKACLDVLTKQMIVHPTVAFLIRHNDRTIYDLPADQSIADRVASIWSVAVSQLVQVVSESPHLTLTGVIAKPEVAHMGKARQFFAVNGHPVQDKMIARSIKDAFGTLLPPTHQPSYALHLAIHPGMVDVNIHPRKDEVRFVNSQEVFRFVFQSVSQALDGVNMAFTSLPTRPTVAVSSRLSAPELPARSLPSSLPIGGRPTLSFAPTVSRDHLVRRSSAFSPEPNRVLTEMVEVASYDTPPMSPVLVVDNCFLVTVSGGKLLLIDQHAAHERILYNQLWDQDAARQFIRQKVLLPVLLELTPQGRAIVDEQRELLATAGFVFTETGDGLALEEVPQFIKQRDPHRFFLGVLRGLQEERNEPELKEYKHRLFATMACKAAVKAGDVLSEAEQRQLLTDLEATGTRFTCPHGRPSHIEVTGAELEKLFKRTGF